MSWSGEGGSKERPSGVRRNSAKAALSPPKIIYSEGASIFPNIMWSARIKKAPVAERQLKAPMTSGWSTQFLKAPATSSTTKNNGSIGWERRRRYAHSSWLWTTLEYDMK